MRRLLLVLLIIGTSVLATAPPAAAFEPVTIVHTERLQVGPYGMTVGFSRWPIRAMQSLDFTFAADGGYAGKTGSVDATVSDGSAAERWDLARHPRKLEVWGLNIQALPADGPWTFHFTIDGPAGRGEGTLTGIPVLEQPGPPLALSWSVAGLPVLVLLAFIMIAWRRTRPERLPERQ
jgi:hypothetical protein